MQVSIGFHRDAIDDWDGLTAFTLEAERMGVTTAWTAEAWAHLVVEDEVPFAVPAAAAIESWFDQGYSTALAWRLDDGRVLFFQVEGVSEFPGGQDSHGLAGEAVADDVSRPDGRAAPAGA